jgi:hypothetical protein
MLGELEQVAVLDGKCKTCMFAVPNYYSHNEMYTPKIISAPHHIP